MRIETKPWDAVDFLNDEEAIRLYIEAAQEEAPDDAAFMAAVLGDVARARNLSELARQTGIARETLYKVTRGEGAGAAHGGVKRQRGRRVIYILLSCNILL